MEIRDSSANFLIEADLFRDFVIELAKLPDPNPPITAKLPAGRALNRLIDQAWAMVDKSVATDYATDNVVANFAAGLAVAAADLTVQLARLAACVEVGPDRKASIEDLAEELEKALSFIENRTWNLAEA